MSGSRHTLLSAPLDCVEPGEAARLCASWASAGGSHHNIISLNARTIVTMTGDPRLRAVLERASLVLADGVSVSIAARILGVPLPGRVPGIDLMTSLLESARERQLACFFFGAREEIVSGLCAALARRYPGLPIAGYHHGYFDRSGSDEIARRVRESGARILFVALGQPEAELWCDRHGASTGAPVTMSVGGSFDVLSGAIRRAPAWMQKTGIEWLWRFVLEPRKRFRVIFVDHAVFLWMIAKELFRGRTPGRSRS